MTENNLIMTAGRKQISRNYEADFIKFILCIIVLLEHSTGISKIVPELGWFNGGTQVSVPLFFTISGFLMAMKLCKNESEDSAEVRTKNFIKSRVTSLYKDYIFALILSFTILMIEQFKHWNSSKDALKGIAEYVIKDIQEAFMLHMAGMCDWRVNGVTWYISAMLIVMIPISYLIIKHKDRFFYIICPLAFILLMGYRYQNYDIIGDSASKFTGFFMLGIFRAATGILGGCIAYIIYEKIRSIRWTRFGKVVLTSI